MSFLREEPFDEKDFPTLRLIKDDYEFIPNFFRAQTTRPDHLDTEVQLVDAILKFTQEDIDDLRTYGFSDQQILEAVMCVGLAKFANYVGFGLGTVPDFKSRIDLEKSKAVTA